MNLVPLLLLVALAGALTALQAPTNAMLAKPAGSPVTAAFISFLIGTAALAAVVFAFAPRPDADALRALPWYAWLGGLYGAVFVAVAAFGAPRIGVGALLTVMIAGQLAAAVALDHFGALGLSRQPVNVERVAGLLLVLIGVVLVRRA